MRILKARLRPPELACIWGRKSTIYNSQIVAIITYFPIIRYRIPRVNRPARPRLVTITYGYRYFGHVQNR
jgi:hypothetical protein